MKLGEQLKYYRLLKGMTLAELASITHVSEPTIQRYESGVIQNPPRERLMAICAALGIDEAQLYGWDTEGMIDEEVRLLARSIQQQTPEVRHQVMAVVEAMLNNLPGSNP